MVRGACCPAACRERCELQVHFTALRTRCPWQDAADLGPIFFAGLLELVSLISDAHVWFISGSLVGTAVASSPV